MTVSEDFELVKTPSIPLNNPYKSPLYISLYIPLLKTLGYGSFKSLRLRALGVMGFRV